MNLQEVSAKTGLAERTLYRYLERGDLKGEKVGSGPGTHWEISEASLDDFLASRNGKAEQGKASDRPEGNASGKARQRKEADVLYDDLRELVTTLKEQLTVKDRQIEQLHVLLQQGQAALPAPKDHRSWWRFWRR